MLIAIEESLHGWGGGGVSAYIRNLTRELLLLDLENDYALFSYFFRSYSKKKNLLPQIEHPRFQRFVPRLPESLIHRLEWDLNLPMIETYLSSRHVDVYHAHRIPRHHWLKTVTTIYDLFPIVHPEWGSSYLKNLYEKIIFPGLKAVDRMIAISEYTKQDMVKYWKIAPEKIEVIHLGVDCDTFKPLDSQLLFETSRHYQLPKRFFLMIGPFDPWSDPRASMRAFTHLPKTFSDIGLVLVGHLGSLGNEALALAENLKISNRARYLGYVPFKDLIALYNLSLCLLYPSLYEGFGLPILEAMACGVPVITSNKTAIPEVCGNAAVQLDPANEEEILAALIKIADDESWRFSMREKGLLRAKSFPWSATARKTLNIYRSL
jgi:glycosyltransferase involved in cell wall biosynthesis